MTDLWQPNNSSGLAPDPALIASQPSQSSLSRPIGFDPGEGLRALADRCEQATYRDNWLILDVLPVFGRTGERLPSAGWKQKRVGERYWNAWLHIFSDLQDVLYLLGDEAPEMIHRDPRKAVAAALRARAGDIA